MRAIDSVNARICKYILVEDVCQEIWCFSDFCALQPAEGLFHGWLVTVIMFPALSWLITRPNGMFYMIFAISLVWSFVPFCMGFAWGGMIWGVVMAGLFFMWAVKVHVNGLKWEWDEIICRSDDAIEWKRFTWSGPNASRSILDKAYRE